MRMSEEQWDVLIYHSGGEHSEALVDRLKKLIRTLQPSIGEEVKVASTAEHFTTGGIFDSIEDALERCTWMFILITDDLLNDKMSAFHNSQILCNSILDKAGNKYVPIYESRDKMKSANVKSYIKALNGDILDELERSDLRKRGLVNTIKSKLIDRKTRERRSKEKHDVKLIADYFQTEISKIKYHYEIKKARLQGAAAVEELRLECTREIQRIASDRNISNVNDFLSKHQIDVSFLTAGTDKSLMLHAEHSHYQSASGIHVVDTGIPSGGREAVEHDDVTEDDETGALGDNAAPPSYRTNYSNTSTASLHDSPHRMSELKSPSEMQPPDDQRPEAVGRASPLLIPPCEDPLLPTVLDEMQSTSRFDTQSLTSFSAVPRHLNAPPYDPEGSMVAEYSDASRNTSLLGSQSHTNLTEFDEDMSQISRGESITSSNDADMDIGDNQVDLSLLETATGLRPLSLFGDGDDESMVVEVDSTAGGEMMFNDTPTATPFRQPYPPMRVMHRSFHADDDDFDMVMPPDNMDDGGAGGGPLSPGLGDVGLNTWPLQRRGSDAGRRRPYRSNLMANRFLSLSSVQSLSSRLCRLYNNPSMNNITELSDRPRLLDGIRHRWC